MNTITTSNTIPAKALQARASFDLDAAFAALPPATPSGSTSPTYRGQAGIRLRPYHVADISDVVLREFARETLGAARCSESYLDALRVVLGNQADAERFGYVLEMNRRTSFATERTMRTIIEQMEAAGITKGVTVGLGEGRVQVVQVYHGDPSMKLEPAEALDFLERGLDRAAVSSRDPVPPCIAEEDIPY